MSENEPNTDDANESTYSRRRVLQGSSALAVMAATGMSINSAVAEEAAPEGDIEELLADLPDNWGRWGEDDELGALNLLGSEQMFEGMKAVQRGGKKNLERFTLQVPMTGFEAPEEGIQDPIFPGRVVGRRDNVEDISNIETGPGGVKTTDDKFVTTLFLQGTTHLDALSHPWYGDELYNGFDDSTTRTEREYFETDMPEFDGAGGGPIIGCESDEPVERTFGMSRNDISSAARSGVAGRGVLLDVGRHMGGNGEGIDDDRLAPGTRIGLDDLQATADAQGVEIRERDILLIRTGSLIRAYETPEEQDAPWNPLVEPGLYFSEELAEWLYDMDIPYLGADNIAVEKVTQTIEQDGEERVFGIPFHGYFMRDLGGYLNEILWLEDLARTACWDGIYEFLFTGAPLYADMSSGAPMNPMVIKAAPEGTPEDGRSDVVPEGRDTVVGSTED